MRIQQFLSKDPFKDKTVFVTATCGFQREGDITWRRKL